MAIKQSFRFLLVLAAVLYVESATRAEITEQYRKTLLRLKAVCDEKFAETTQEYNLLYNQTRNSQTKAVTETQDHLNALKAILLNAIKDNSGEARHCLQKLQDDVEHLSTSTISFCTNNGNFTTLSLTRSKFNVMGLVATNTIYYCQNLNPLDTEDETYRHCLVDKIMDINDQIAIIELTYEQQSGEVLTYTVTCLSANTSGIFKKVGDIMEQINNCIEDNPQENHD